MCRMSKSTTEEDWGEFYPVLEEPKLSLLWAIVSGAGWTVVGLMAIATAIVWVVIL
jgi:hypothetical protein